MKKHILLAILCIVALLIAPANGVSAQVNNITITDLGTLGGTNSQAVAINEQGQIVGNSDTDSGTVHAFLWEDGQMIDLGTLGGSESHASDINDNGQIVGTSLTESGELHGFLWENGSMLDLGIQVSSVDKINNLGQAIGRYRPGGQRRAFVWQNGTVTEIGTFGGSYSYPADINENGQVAGTGALPGIEESLVEHAFLWENDVLMDIGTLFDDGTVYDTASSTAFAINNLGQIVGESEHIWYGGQYGFLWSNGQMTDLGTLGGGAAFPSDINDHGQITGSSSTVELFQTFHAFLWENGVMTDLGTLGGDQSFAADINESGQTVGTSDTASGNHAFLWENGTMRDLGALDGYCCSRAVAINEQGYIIGSSQNDSSEHATLWTIAAEISITIDIKPGSAINPINLTSRGVVPVAVLTTPEFDASTLDPTTVTFAGAAPLRWVKTDVDGDGDVDLLFHFPVNKLDLTSSSRNASLTGETFDDVFVKGTDVVTIVPTR